MTKRERAQVVELLRCAADCIEDESPYFTARDYLGIPRDSFEHRTAWRVREDVMSERRKGYRDIGTKQYRNAFLEMAARVEEGTWP